MSHVKRLRVIVVSPSDVLPERDAVARVVEETNRILSPSLAVFLELWRWETDAHPGFHADGPQGLIDDLMDIADSDLVVGVFWKRFGTPTGSADSGTEHELSKAWQSWHATKRPQTMVYFKQAPASPASSAELEQWSRVLRFKERFPKEGLWWSCDGEEDLERLFRGHLQRFLLAHHGNDSTDRQSVSGFFDAPVVTDAVPRAEALAALHAAIQHEPVVVLGGLSGSGKTYLLSSYVTTQPYSRSYARVLWHDPTQGETLDNLLALVEADCRLGASSTHSRCKALVARLRSENALLVVDNYQDVDHATYSLLVDAFALAGLPCRLVLVSQTYVASPGVTSDPYQVLIPGFSSEEAQLLLARRQVPNLTAGLLRDLLAKTGGLPFALQLFALLVGHFGHEPRELLAGAMEHATRVRAWFERILAMIGSDARGLLPYLSIDQAPFNIGVVRLWARHIPLETAEVALGELQQRYLVQTHSPYRWKVHELVGLLARAELSQAQNEKAHSALGHYYLRGLPRRQVTVSDEEFVWKVRAFRHLRKSPADRVLARVVLEELAATAKTRGHYSLFLELSAEASSDPDPANAWIRYHHAHCALILGDPASCLRVIQPLLYETEALRNATQSLAFTRLFAEALGSMRDEERALSALQTAVEASAGKNVAAVAKAQARSVLVWLQTRLGQLDDARVASDELLVEAHKRNDSRGAAVALARKGIIQLRRNALEDARQVLKTASELFAEAGDRRGQAWSLSHLAECELLGHETTQGTTTLSAAFAIAAEIGECGVDHRDLTRRLETLACTPQLKTLLAGEGERLATAQAHLPGRLTTACS